MKEPKEFDYFKAWLLFFVVATGGMLLVGIVINSLLAAVLGAAGAPGGQMNRILLIVSLLICLSIHYVTFRAVVGKYLFPKIEEDAPRPV
jgi:hypothetical protein